jgi:hypothetical protein
VDGQEVLGDVQPLDDAQLVADLAQVLVGQAIREEEAGARPGQVGQMLLRRLAGGNGLVGVLVAELLQVEAQRVGDRHGAAKRVLVAGEEAGHLGGGLQMAFGVGLQATAGLGQGHLLADAGEDVGQGAAAGLVEADGVGGDHGAACGGRDGGEGVQPRAVVAAVKRGGRKVELVGPELGPGGQPGLELGGGRVLGGGEGDQAFAPARSLLESEVTLALGGWELALGQEPAEAAVGGAVARVDDQVLAGGEDQAAADAERGVRGLAGDQHADDASEAVAVGDP